MFYWWWWYWLFLYNYAWWSFYLIFNYYFILTENSNNNNMHVYMVFRKWCVHILVLCWTFFSIVVLKCTFWVLALLIQMLSHLDLCFCIFLRNLFFHLHDCVNFFHSVLRLVMHLKNLFPQQVSKLYPVITWVFQNLVISVLPKHLIDRILFVLWKYVKLT